MIVVLCPRCHGIDVVANCKERMLHCNECDEDFAFTGDDYIIADVTEVA
jgi:hypothetical protein